MTAQTRLIRKGFVFKLKPTSQQEAQLRQYCGATRWVYNHMLAQRKEAYQTTGKSPSTNSQVKQLPILKRQEETAWLKTIHSQVLQNAVFDLDDAFARFFSKQNGYPKFKKKYDSRQSFSYPQGVKVDGNAVWLPMIGWLRFRKSREIEGTIKRATIKRKASGWSISLNCEVVVEKPKPTPVTEYNSVGIDLGSIDLVTTSQGQKIENQRHYRKAERRLKRAQRIQSRRKPGSRRHAKAKQRVSKLHEHIASCRKDDLHKISRQLTDENQAVFCENLHVAGIAKRMGKSVGDAGWSELVRQLKFKTLWTGKTLYQVDRFFPSSKTCSCCGYKHADLDLSSRRWQCPNCHVWLDRDINAAVNIHREGLKQHLAAGQTERLNARGQMVRPSTRARLAEARISRL